MRLQAFRRETRMRQANGCEPVLFCQIETHKRFRWILLPVWQPGEGKHVGRLDRSIFSFYGERPAEAGACHQPADRTQRVWPENGLQSPTTPCAARDWSAPQRCAWLAL